MPYAEKFIIGNEVDMHKLVEAGFDVRAIRKTDKAIYYRVMDVATCVVEMNHSKVILMCTDRDNRRFLCTDETGKYHKIEVEKEPASALSPPLTREKPSSPGWYRRILKREGDLELDFVKVDVEQDTNELRVWSIDGAVDYLANLGNRFVWSSKPEKATFC
jgi:hypothetical protein